ncbi:ABC transporter permease [Tahibacter soli]|uniref:ABC transporter permease n=1 Tax=Tahibacter soli TaxID=2983605 RepID=A0A9X3YJ28_9GAMM|nr:ABC transporter permease [Tahibacter soli]MDC8013299.1 ABC transporter permease [Tahibacter soli]
MKAAWVVFLKEVMENLRDRRTVTNALLMAPLLGPLLFVGLTSIVISKELEKSEQALSVPVIGAEHAPNLVAFLGQNGVRVKPAIDNPEAAIIAQDVDMVLRIPAGYGEAWSAGRTAQVELLFDSSQRESGTPVARLRGVLSRYASQNSTMRLLARGLAPSVAMPLAVAERDQSTPQSRSGLLFAMLPYFLILSSFMGGMYLAIDTTAGERERQSLEPLFANPVTRSAILTGKLAATCTFAMASLALSVIAFGLAGPLIPSGKIGMVLDFGPTFAVTVLVMMLPLVLLASCLQTLIAAFAKSYREAQTYLSVLLLIPALPSMMLVVSPIKAKLWMYAVPLLSQHLAITRLVRAEGIEPAQLGLCLASGFVVALVAWAVTARVYRSERLAISG